MKKKTINLLLSHAEVSLNTSKRTMPSTHFFNKSYVNSTVVNWTKFVFGSYFVHNGTRYFLRSRALINFALAFSIGVSDTERLSIGL